MFVTEGARAACSTPSARSFSTEEWPRISATIQRLGLKAEELLKNPKSKEEDR